MILLIMGQTADFFIATEAELSKVLPGWKPPRPPLDEPVIRKAVNPFTGEPMEYESYVDPSGGPADSDAVDGPILKEAGQATDWNWITHMELARMIEFSRGVDAAEAEKLAACEQFWGPATSLGTVFRVPVDVLDLLAQGSSGSLAKLMSDADEGIFDRSEEAYGSSWRSYKSLLAQQKGVAEGCISTLEGRES